MGMGWHEWPLMLFTVLGQSVVGAIIVMGIAVIGGNLNQQQDRAVHRSMFFLWLLMGIAFVASTLHLGSPLRAFNSLNRVGVEQRNCRWRVVLRRRGVLLATGGAGQNASGVGQSVAVGDHGVGHSLCLRHDAGVSNRYCANLA